MLLPNGIQTAVGAQLVDLQRMPFFQVPGGVPAPAPMEAGLTEGKDVSASRSADWMVREFKTVACNLDNNASAHDHRCCPFFHSGRDRRRPLLANAAGGPGGFRYRGEPCGDRFDDDKRVGCARGDNCMFSHSTAEVLYHPEFFRRRLCQQARRCPRGRFCAFAHGRHELLAPHFSPNEESDPSEELIAHRFKTLWCPMGGPHDWESCVYAHTYRDWRRVPLLGYSSHPCPRWTSSVANGSAELTYEERCPLGMACPLAHGAKEQFYHPKFYKTRPCSDPNCRRGPLCAFTHGDHDAREPQADDASQRVVRKPIPQAEEILKQYQPTYSSPPMYHTFEDAPRSGGGGGQGGSGAQGGGGGESANGGDSGGKSKSRRARGGAGGRGGGDKVSLMDSLETPFAAPFPMDPQSSVMFAALPQPGLCQWVPAGEHLPCPAPSQVVGPHPSAMGAAMLRPMPLGCGAPQMLWRVNTQPAQPQHCFFAAVPQQIPLPATDASARRVPEDAFHHPPQERVAAAAARAAATVQTAVPSVPVAVQTGLPAVVPDVADSCMGSDGPSPVGSGGGNFASLTVNTDCAEDGDEDVKGLGGLSGLDAKIVDLSAWRRREYHLQGGWRTPSSFGSPPLSGAPTAASSPRNLHAVPSSSWSGDNCSEAPVVSGGDDLLREAVMSMLPVEG
jgi:uncharacterized membrane protein YgcG